MKDVRMDYSLFNEIEADDQPITATKICKAIKQSDDSKTVLCFNGQEWYLDNLDEYFGKDDTIGVPVEIAELTITLQGVKKTMVKGMVAVYMIN